jgi:beta-phosphoglucomutase-like phosphatase (HAD superfamily)
MALAIAGALEFEAFGAVIAGDDVTHSKPHPEPYQLGAAALGVDPADCVAFEDSAPGVASATAAGAVTIGVPLHIPLIPESTFDIWHDIDGKTVADIFEVYRSRRAS